eukprot:scaffold1963_cov242-Pinguiococcus_pyrenoidosus.AAC.4
MCPVFSPALGGPQRHRLARFGGHGRPQSAMGPGRAAAAAQLPGAECGACPRCHASQPHVFEAALPRRLAALWRIRPSARMAAACEATSSPRCRTSMSCRTFCEASCTFWASSTLLVRGFRVEFRPS